MIDDGAKKYHFIGYVFVSGNTTATIYMGHVDSALITNVKIKDAAKRAGMENGTLVSVMQFGCMTEAEFSGDK